MTKPCLLVYPHQLYAHSLSSYGKVYLIEDPLYFKQYPFCVQKLLLHRASMKHYEFGAKEQGAEVSYIEQSSLHDSADIAQVLAKDCVTSCAVCELDDDWLNQKLQTSFAKFGIGLHIIPSPGFLTPLTWSAEFFKKKGRFFFTDFYIAQRLRMKVLVEKDKPVGGKWSFDHDNRKKLPKDLTLPSPPVPVEDSFTKEAKAYVSRHFPNAPGHGLKLLYPHTREAARTWLNTFIEQRLCLFGDYEDAITVKGQSLFHSVLTPMLNVGLITPEEVLHAVLATKNIPLNSLEGFVRQLIGWREYMRAMYHLHGRKQRSLNFFRHTRPIPKAFYDGTTGLLPVDTVIQSVLATGYCHHIERLMVLGNCMLLCEFEPKAIYQWFMELFIDSYDWVMVPNVFSMSQYADGGQMTTKPYISGSSYILKMSDYKRGPWCEVWDALYWNHIAKHKKFYASNHRMSVMAAMCDKLGQKLEKHQKKAGAFLASFSK